MCIFTGWWPWSIKGHTQMASNPRQITSVDLFFIFHAIKSFNKPVEFLLYKTKQITFSVCVYCNKSQKTSQRVMNDSHDTRLRLVAYLLFFIRCDVICDPLQYTRTEKCNLCFKYIRRLRCWIVELISANKLILHVRRSMVWRNVISTICLNVCLTGRRVFREKIIVGWERYLSKLLLCFANPFLMWYD